MRPVKNMLVCVGMLWMLCCVQVPHPKAPRHPLPRPTCAPLVAELLAHPRGLTLLEVLDVLECVELLQAEWPAPSSALSPT